MVRKGVRYAVIILLLVSAFTGLNTIIGIFSKNEVQAVPDYSGMQKTAEFFMELYLDWSKPLEDRQMKMKQIAPGIVPYLVEGEQTVNFLRSEKPYFSADRGFVDITIWTTIPEEDNGQQILIPRKYNSTVLFVRQSDGTYLIDSVPTLKINRNKSELVKVETDSSKRAVEEMLTPILKVFIPAYLSGDMSTAQNLLLPESEIKAQQGDYAFVKIAGVRIRSTADDKLGEYVADVTVTVKDKQAKQSISILINMLVRQESTKFYVIKAIT